MYSSSLVPFNSQFGNSNYFSNDYYNPSFGAINSTYTSPFAPGGNRFGGLGGYSNIGGFGGLGGIGGFGGANNGAMIGMAIATAVTGLVTLITAISQSKNENSHVCSNEDSKTKNFDRQPARFDFNDFGDDSFDVSLT
jgi:hypothetical protein